MQKITIDPGLYNKIYYSHIKDSQRTQIFFGGSSSGKSVFLAQRTVEDVLAGGRNYLVCRAVGRTIRRSVYNEIVKVIRDWGLSEFFNINKSELIITCANGYQIMFSGLDDVEKVKSMTPENGVITDIWVEEATETNHDAVKQLYKRQRGKSEKPKRLTMSFNPILQTHWIYSTYFKNWDDEQTVKDTDKLLVLKTTYKDNEYLTTEDIADLENETDEYFYNVYTLGLWGTLGDVIFKNWKVVDLSDTRKRYDTFHNGLDFGFAADPAAVLVTARNAAKKEIYIFDELYERGLTNDILAEEVIRMIDQDYIYCDSAEPKSIQELKNHGVRALATEKGADSILHGIQWLQQNKIFVDKNCVNMIMEFQQYQWQKDKDGNSIKKPVDKVNHLIDGLRYAYNREWKQKQVARSYQG